MKKIIIIVIILLASISYAQERRPIISNMYIYVGYDNHGNMGYHKSIFAGMIYELDYRGNLLWSNNLWFNPRGKIIAGGYYLDYESRVYSLQSNWLFGGGINLNYTDNDAWQKIAYGGAFSFGYEWNNYYKSRLIFDYIFNRYNDKIHSYIQGLEITTTGDMIYNLFLYSKIGFYHGSSINPCGNDFITAQIAVGYKL